MKKKILLIGKLPPPYMGPSVAFELLINSKLKELYELDYLDIKANETLDTLGKFSFSKLLLNKKIYNAFAAKLMRNKPDLVLIPISQTTMGFFKDAVFMWLCKRHGVKCVIQLRGSNFKTWFSTASPVTQSIVKYVLKIPSGVIVLGNKLKYLFSDFFGDDKIFVVPNGGDFPVTPATHTNKIFRFIYLANLQASKGILDVIHAVVLLKAKASQPFEMHIAGKWRDHATQDQIQDLIQKHNLPVIIHQPLSGKAKFEFIATGDAFVFTPRAPEGHPWVIIEAMAAGLPIITTDQGAITESVADGVNGYIVPPSDPEAIATKMQLFLETPVMAQTMGKESRDIYQKSFTEAAMIQNLAAVFNKLCS